MISTKEFEFKQIIFLVTKEGQKLSFKNDNIVINKRSIRFTTKK